MAAEANHKPTYSQLSRRDRRILIAAALAPFFFALCLIVLAWWVVSHMFTQPPDSVDHTPLMSDARNVIVQQTSNPEGRVITYSTEIAPTEVYSFYEGTLVKDGWGGEGYFAKPELTSTGILVEWDESGPDGCEDLGYTLHVAAEQTEPTTTNVRLELTKIDPCNTPYP